MFFDDLTEGYSFRTEAKTLSRDDIVRFATDWDPQEFHLDEAAGEASHFGGLVASGFHTLLTAFTLTLEANVWTEASMGAGGMTEITWLKPVRPGDTLTVTGTVKSLRESRTKPDRGFAEIAYEARNQDGDVVMTYGAKQILRKRP